MKSDNGAASLRGAELATASAIANDGRTGDLIGVMVLPAVYRS